MTAMPSLALPRRVTNPSAQRRATLSPERLEPFDTWNVPPSLKRVSNKFLTQPSRQSSCLLQLVKKKQRRLAVSSCNCCYPFICIKTGNGIHIDYLLTSFCFNFFFFFS